MAALLTWAGYFGFTHFSNLSQSNSLINLAEYNYTQAKNYNALALRTFNLLRERSEDARSNGRERELENELFRLIAEQENGYNSALEFISRATEYGLRESVVNRMCRDIFKSSLNFYLKVENYDSLQSFLRQARIRWRAIFDRAVSQDAELAALVNKIDNRVGTLEIKGVPHPGPEDDDPGYGGQDHLVRQHRAGRQRRASGREPADRRAAAVVRASGRELSARHHAALRAGGGGAGHGSGGGKEFG